MPALLAPSPCPSRNRDGGEAVALLGLADVGLSAAPSFDVVKIFRRLWMLRRSFEAQFWSKAEHVRGAVEVGRSTWCTSCPRLLGEVVAHAQRAERAAGRIGFVGVSTPSWSAPDAAVGLPPPR
jgi:hypothetical protein